MADSWTETTQLLQRLQPLSDQPGPKTLSEEDFKVLMKLAQDGALVHHRNLGQILDKILPTDEYQMIDQEDWQRVGIMILSVSKEISSMVNIISRRLRLKETVEKSNA